MGPAGPTHNGNLCPYPGQMFLCRTCSTPCVTRELQKRLPDQVFAGPVLNLKIHETERAERGLLSNVQLYANSLLFSPRNFKKPEQSLAVTAKIGSACHSECEKMVKKNILQRKKSDNRPDSEQNPNPKHKLASRRTCKRYKEGLKAKSH